MEEVWAAADAVLGLGERPTIERVRQQLGRGSPNTVGPMLDGWFGSLARRLQAPADLVESTADAELALPGPVIRAAKALWGRALQQADEQASAQFAQAHIELNEQAEALRQAQENLAQETQRMADRSEAYAVAMQARDAQISELGRLVQELQQQLVSCQDMLVTARAEGVQMRLTAEADRRRQESKETEHQAERSRLEERALGQERRLNSEVDRARQESKRLALQLEADQRKYAQSLSDSQARVRDLEAHSGTLQIENAGVSKELQSARYEMNTLQAKLDERSNDMFALLNELRDRFPTSPPAPATEAAPKTRVRKSRT